MAAMERITGEIDTREASVFMTNLTALAGLWVLGFPLSPGAIRTMVVSSVLAAATVAQFVLRCFQTTGSAGGYNGAHARRAI
jgi:hypothetical protein